RRPLRTEPPDRAQRRGPPHRPEDPPGPGPRLPRRAGLPPRHGLLVLQPRHPQPRCRPCRRRPAPLPRAPAPLAVASLPPPAPSLPQAQTLWRNLAKAPPAAADYRNSLARCRYFLGNLYFDRNQPGPAERAYEDALQGWEELAGQHPDTPAYSFHLARVCAQL